MRSSSRAYRLSTLLLVGLLGVTPAAFADERAEELQRRIDELTREAEQAADLSRLMELQQELMRLSSELLSAITGRPALPVGRAATPQEQVDRIVEAINRGYRDAKRGFGQLRGQSQPPVPLTRATRLKGEMVVRGYDEEPPYRGWVWLKLAYTVRESFVGYVIIREFYDPGSGRLLPGREYSLASISTGIDVGGVAGRQCMQASAGLPGACVDWEQITRADIDDSNYYPSIHDWVIMGSSETGTLKIKLQSPAVTFRSANGRAARGLGCFGTTLELGTASFEAHLASGSYRGGDNVGHEFQGAPHCAVGSTIALELELCNPDTYAELDHCGQIEALLEDLKLVLLMRDTFREMAPLADDDEHLVELVNEKISERYPGINLQSEAYLEKHAGGYEICSGTMDIADPCDGCVPAPLCRWQEEGLKIHEKVHQLDIQSSPETRKLFCDTFYQQANYPDANALQRYQAQVWAELDFHAYNEQAKFLRDTVEQQLGQSSGCAFEPRFYSDLDKAMHAIEP